MIDYKPTQLVIDGTLGRDEYEGLLSSLGAMSRGHQWWIGDALVWGEKHFDEGEFSQLAEAAGLEPKTLTNYRYVAASVKPSRRREDLTWSHHAEVARLGGDAQKTCLARAAREGWSVLQLRDHVAMTYPQSNPQLFGDDDGRDPLGEHEHAEVQKRLERLEHALDAGDEIDETDVRWLLDLCKRLTRHGR